MGHFLDTAYIILKKSREPLSAREITAIGLKQGVLITKGRTPWQTMKAKLSTDILTNKDNSLFMRTDQGKFGLRVWKKTGEDEYIADRFQKALLDEEILVFPASSLNNYISCPGLHPTPIDNGRALLNECRPMSRRLAEDDFNFIQLITVFILKYKSRYLTYKRTKRLPESRLHDFYSIAFGGHVNATEVPMLFDIFEPKNACLFLDRELREEVKIKDYKPEIIKYKGLLYDDSQRISSQHLGIVFDVNLESDKYEIGERGFLMDHKFETLDEISSRLYDFENWSVLLVNFEKNNLS